MKLKVLFFLSCVGVMVWALGVNYYGHQSIVNLGTVRVFTAPASGMYFINGQLYLPQLTQNGVSNSQVVASVSKNQLTYLYYGVPGASGFSIPAVQLVSNDAITVAVTSNANIDQGLNVIKGDIFFGSSY